MVVMSALAFMGNKGGMHKDGGNVLSRKPGRCEQGMEEAKKPKKTKTRPGA
jgi:hypothetical protein